MMEQYKLSHIARAAMLLAVLAMLAACEKPILDDGPVDGATKSYTYSTADQLEAGYKLHISGTYTEAVGVALTARVRPVVTVTIAKE